MAPEMLMGEAPSKLVNSATCKSRVRSAVLQRARLCTERRVRCATRESDVYALGMLLYEVLSRCPYALAVSCAVLRRRLRRMTAVEIAGTEYGCTETAYTEPGACWISA
eukprot:1099925-Rhodomonas_salina.1